MFRRSTNRAEHLHSPARVDNQLVSDPSYQQSPVTPNHPTTPGSNSSYLVSNNTNGVCASQPQSPATHNNPLSCPKQFNPQLDTAEPFRVVFDLIESELLRYPRDPGYLAGQPVHNRAQSIQVARSDCERVCRQYFTLRSTQIADKVKISLGSHTFNNWPHSDAQLISYLKFMFIDLDLPRLCRFPVDALETWLLAVYRRYNDVPFHNFKHAFMVTQMMYALIKQADLVQCLAPLDLFILLFSALSHDLDHPGFTNSYQINARSWLSLRYNDISPLENHHCAVAFDLISHPATNLLVGLSPSEYQWFRKAVVKCILATDMAHHKDCVEQFRAVIPKLVQTDQSLVETKDSLTHGNDQRDDGEREHGRASCDMNNLRARLTADPDSRLTLMLILLKTCDISNEARPTPVADPWLDRLLDEFFFQALAEKQSGLPVLPHMDPDKVTRDSSQLGFIKFLLLPLLQDLVFLFPSLKSIETGARERILYFELMKRQADRNEAGVSQPHASDNLESTSCAPPSRTSPQLPNTLSFSPAHELKSLHPTRSSSLGTNANPQFDNDALGRVGKVRCLSTPIHQHIPCVPPVNVLSSDLPTDTCEPQSSREHCSHNLTGDLCSALAVTRDCTGAKRHHISQQPLAISTRLLLDYNHQLEPSVKRDADRPLSDNVVVVAVSRKTSTGSMVAALN